MMVMGVGGAAVGAGPIVAGNSRTMSHLMCIVPGVLELLVTEL